MSRRGVIAMRRHAILVAALNRAFEAGKLTADEFIAACREAVPGVSDAEVARAAHDLIDRVREMLAWLRTLEVPPPEHNDIGHAAVDHLRTMYPAALAAVPASAATSLRNFINARVRLAIERREDADG